LLNRNSTIYKIKIKKSDQALPELIDNL